MHEYVFDFLSGLNALAVTRRVAAASDFAFTVMQEQVHTHMYVLSLVCARIPVYVHGMYV